MAIELRRAKPDDLEHLVAFDFRNFGATPEEGDVEEIRGELDLDRFLLALDDQRLIGAAGSYEMELTLPGGAQLPVSGVTWVSVAASHRRQGVARQLMSGLDDLSAELGEPFLALTASEGGIYERFGYGMASRTRVIEIDRHRAVIDPRWEPEPVVLVDGQDCVPELIERYERYRQAQVGEVSRPTEEQFRVFTMDRKKPAFCALHPDGYALYTIEERWNNGHPAHQLNVTELVAVTPQAHLALWNLIFSVDLVGPIRSVRSVALDDPLPHYLVDPRALRTVALNDGLWVKVTDPVRCFGARNYRCQDRLTIGVVESRDDLLAGADPKQRIEVSNDSCQEVDTEVDLTVTRASLGTLLLGGEATEMARGRRLAATPEVLGRADAFFGSSPRAHCRTGF